MLPLPRLLLVAVVVIFVQWQASANALPWDSVEGKAESHEHWKHLVQRMSLYSLLKQHESDETAHITDIQDYYKQAFEQGWERYRNNERALFRLLNTLETVSAQGYLSGKDKATIQDETEHVLELGVQSKPIPGRYIVMLHADADDYVLDRTVEVLEQANLKSQQRVRASDIHPIKNIGKGFVATLNYKTLHLLKHHPLVDHIEEDLAVRRSEYIIPAQSDTASVESDGPIWNLDRLDQRSKILDHKYEPEGSGKDVDIYIIDTGVLASHEEFGGRVHYAGFDAVDYMTGTHNQGKDCNGHGTHCAGTAAGKTYGVAKEANIYNLRALNCHGTGAVSGIVIAIDKIVEHYKKAEHRRPIVISQSLDVHRSVSFNKAIHKATEAGLVMVGAAGNQADYSCKYSPASAKVGIAVGATDMNDNMVFITNTGECTDIMAPGLRIKSASVKCNTCTKIRSGTSMSAPHVAGYAAIILGLHPHLSATEVKNRIMYMSTKGKVKISHDQTHETPNRLLYVAKATAAESDIGEFKDMASQQSARRRS